MNTETTWPCKQYPTQTRCRHLGCAPVDICTHPSEMRRGEEFTHESGSKHTGWWCASCGDTIEVTPAVTNDLPTFEFAGNWAELPMHVMSVTDHECIYCNESPIWASYDEYVAHFWANEYEGAPGHAPSDEESFEIVASLCVA